MNNAIDYAHISHCKPCIRVQKVFNINKEGAP